MYVYKPYEIYIITLEKTHNTITNENIKNITNNENNKLCAEYIGCNFIVRKMEHKLNKSEKNELYDVFNNITYKIDNLINNSITYYLNKKVAYYYDLLNYDNNYTGEIENWYKSGQIALQCNYKNGLLNGSYMSWYINGNIGVKCNYLNNVMDGDYEEYYGDGRLKTKCVYKNGLPENQTITEILGDETNFSINTCSEFSEFSEYNGNKQNNEDSTKSKKKRTYCVCVVL